MTIDERREEVRLLLTKTEEVDDPRLAVQLIRKRIAELNETGQDVPEELIRLQNRYVDECIHTSQGR